jgi:hypothetical protein
MSMKNTWTANPSHIAMPDHGRALGMLACPQQDSALAVSAMETIAVRALVVTTATRTKGVFPGNSAWRPPIC